MLRQGNIGLARAKAESVIKDEIHTDLLQVLEMYLGVVLEQFAEIEKKYSSPCNITVSSHPPRTTRLIPSPPLVEAASGIIYSAPVLGIRGTYALGIRTRHANPCLQNCRRPVTFSSNDLVKNFLAQQPEIKIDMSLRGCVTIIMLPIFPINSRPGRSGSFSPSPISCDARRLPCQGGQGPRCRMDPWLTITREVRPPILFT